MQALRKDADSEISASDGNFDYIVMNQYGHIKVDKVAAIQTDIATMKADLATMKADLADILAILNDCYNSSNHSLKVSVL